MIMRKVKYKYNQHIVYAFTLSTLIFSSLGTAQAATSITIQDTKIDSQFINKMEGSVLKGYVPLPGSTQSGVTIASGLDLGQMHLKDFNNLPINSALKAKLEPYIGLKKFQAVAFLKAHPLTINSIELKELNIVAANKILQPLVKNYDKASKIPFVSLPPQAQTALFSFAYQYGSYFMKNPQTSQLWSYYATQNWSKATQTLRSFKLYANRRNQEAHLLYNLADNQ